MPSTLLDRFGLGNDRAVANARRAAEQRLAEDRLVAGLAAAMARHDALARRSAPAPVTALQDAA